MGEVRRGLNISVILFLQPSPNPSQSWEGNYFNWLTYYVLLFT